MVKSEEKGKGSQLPWHQRTKAVCIACAYEDTMLLCSQLTAIIGVGARGNVTQGNIPNVTKNLCFLPMEKYLREMPNCARNYGKMLHRQMIHCRTIKCKFIGLLIGDIDEVMTTRLGFQVRLQEFILNMKSNHHSITNADDSRLNVRAPLFHSMDYCVDSSIV